MGSIAESQIIWNITFVVDNIRIKGAFFFFNCTFLVQYSSCSAFGSQVCLHLCIISHRDFPGLLLSMSPFLFFVVQSFSHVWLFATSWTAARLASLSYISRSLLRLMSIESVMPSNYLIFCCPLFLLPLIFPSIKVLSNESALCIRWPKYWSFSFSISPSDEYSELISFRIDWFDLLAV